MSHLIFIILILFSVTAFSQKKWDGGGGNGLWSNALNWTGNTVPAASDVVVLDNSLVLGSYTVTLPNTAVSVRSILIIPTTSKTIDLILPKTNTVIPAFTATGPGYGMSINSGGTFKNSSGSSSGNAVVVADSIMISNDGKYVHNTSSSHSSNVMVLSRAPGTEDGIFELDIPSASSTISMSGRTFGKLVLRSTAAGGTCNYTAAGTSRISVMSTLDIGAGVNLSLNCSDTIAIGGDLLVNGTLNLGNSTRSVAMVVQGNISQAVGGIITETGSGIQTLIIAGGGTQLVTLRGSIQNSVGLIKRGAGIAWFKAAVSLPYKFSLMGGKVLTGQGLITLQAGCTIEVDSLATNSFIEGPLKKDGLNNQSFLFPVGRSNVLRWLQLNNATGSFTVEYFNSDPHEASSAKGVGIDHLSSVEYWEVNATGSSTARVKLSFVDPYSGGVTNLAGLRVARLINGTWEDAGNFSVAGSPGSDGWVSSNAASGFSANSKLFALASAMGLENPLPLSSIKLKMIRNVNDLYFYWHHDKDLLIETYELQQSLDGKRFSTLKKLDHNDVYEKYSITLKDPHVKTFYRLKGVTAKEAEYFSEIVTYGAASQHTAILGSNLVLATLRLIIDADHYGDGKLLIYNSNGVLVKRVHFDEAAAPVLDIDVSSLKPGTYFLKNPISGSIHRFQKL